MQNAKLMTRYYYDPAANDFRAKECACKGGKFIGEAVGQDMDTLLIFKGVVPTTIDGYKVSPGLLVLGLTQQDFERFKSDPMNRFIVPTEDQVKKAAGEFGKASE